MMGSESDDAAIRESPVHEVVIASYWIDRTEVTNAQFSAFMTFTGHETIAEQEAGGYGYLADSDYGTGYIKGATWQHPQGSGSDLSGLDNHPVVPVSWVDANAFCAWRDAHLPTEAEWEKAARGTTERIYPWGNEFDGTKVNFCEKKCPDVNWKDESVDDGYRLTAPVGSYPNGASPYNALDMSGNVAEWTDSPYDPYPGNTEYIGDDNTQIMVFRGGSWFSESWSMRSSFRNWVSTEDRSDSIGFRCAISSLP